MFTAFLIKYAEIGVKGKNKYLFEEALAKQVKYALKRCEGEFKVTRTRPLNALALIQPSMTDSSKYRCHRSNLIHDFL